MRPVGRFRFPLVHERHLNADELTPEKLQEYQKAQGEVGAALGRLLAVTEAYPDLKANQNFLELQQELSDTENKIQASRRFYNTTVMAMNTKIESFPTNILAKMFHFEKETFFELDEEEKELARKAPKVSF